MNLRLRAETLKELPTITLVNGLNLTRYNFAVGDDWTDLEVVWKKGDYNAYIGKCTLAPKLHGVYFKDAFNEKGDLSTHKMFAELKEMWNSTIFKKSVKYAVYSKKAGQEPKLVAPYNNLDLATFNDTVEEAQTELREMYKHDFDEEAPTDEDFILYEHNETTYFIGSVDLIEPREDEDENS